MKSETKIREKTRKVVQYIKLKKLFSGDNEFSKIHPELVDVWKKKFYQMIRYSSERTFPIVEEFLTVHFDKISSREIQKSEKQIPILICAIKNDIEKITHFMEHYRKLGIREFLFVDNMSTDGTFEYLVQQPDTIVYQCQNPFTADRKIAWMNRLIAEVGDNFWFLMVDSDEFVTYIDCDKYSIDELVNKCKQKGYKRLGSVMLDMYSKGPLFISDVKKNFIDEFKYMDKDTYKVTNENIGIKVKGGPRKRIFGTEMKLSKYALFYFESDDIVPSAHYLIPHEKGYNVPLCIGLLHYKFINQSDYIKVIEAVETGMHSNNSEEYKTYFEGIKDNKTLSFYSEEHSILYTQDSLKKVDVIVSIFE